MDTEVRILFKRADNQEFVIDESDWGAVTINGASAAEYEVFTESRGAGDGDIITGKRVKSRSLEVVARVMDTLQNDVLRRQALTFFNPKQVYKIYLTYMGITRWIDGTLAAVKCDNAYIWAPQQLSVFLVCPDPFWRSVDDFGQDIAAETPRWGWPYMDHSTYGVLASLYNFARDVVFEYDGDVPGYFRAELTADAEVTNPKLIKDGYYVRILDTMQAGDTISIDFEAGRVAKNGKNILAKVDRASNFTAIQMSPGTNTVRYEADAGDNALHVVLYYNKLYLGV